MNTTGLQSHETQTVSVSRPSLNKSLKIALCPPDLDALQKVMKGESVDATFIIQSYIARGLSDRGHRLTFFGPSLPDNVIYAGQLDSLKPVKRTWTSSRFFNFAAKLVWRLQKMIGIPYLNIFSNLRLMDACMQSLPGNDLIYERNMMYRFGVAMACKRLGMPYILYFEADDVLEHDIMKKPITGLQRMQAQWAIRYNLEAADRVICVSEPLKAHLVHQWKVPEAKIAIFPNVADIRKFHPDEAARKKIRERLGIEERPLVIFVGNFYEWHDVVTLLNAFVRVLVSYPDARLVLVGDGEKRQAMSQLATELDINHAVIFTGMVAHMNVPGFMAAADIAVVPYPVLEQDIWLSPLKLFEYMAAGNAIVASNVGQLPEWITDELNGLLVPPGDVSALARAIERLIADPALRFQLGQYAREESVRKHSWDRYLSDLEDLYISVVGRGQL